MSDSLPLAITLYHGDRIVGSRTIRVGVLIRRSVLIAVAPKRRGEVVGHDDVTAEVRWLGPTAPAEDPSEIIGAAAKSRIGIGQLITLRDVMPAIAVDKGDIVAIRCLSGTVAISTRGRALADGRIGDLVQFQALDSKRTFFARMDAPGRAVIAIGTPPALPDAPPHAAPFRKDTLVSRLEEASR
jgi:flagella basal body P-ring formation protein FlgA